VTESEVLSLVRGEMRAAFEAGLAAAESAAFCDPFGPSCAGYRAALAEIEKTTAEPPVKPQPAATGLEMPPECAWMSDVSVNGVRWCGSPIGNLPPVGTKLYLEPDVRSLLDRALALLAEKDREIARLRMAAGPLESALSGARDHMDRDSCLDCEERIPMIEAAIRAINPDREGR
jgi:hypothetical protein